MTRPCDGAADDAQGASPSSAKPVAVAPFTVVIGGKIVVEDHQPRMIDVEGLYREVRAFCAKGLAPEQRARADFLRKIKPYVQAWYGTWHEVMLDQPFYRVNSRT